MLSAESLDEINNISKDDPASIVIIWIEVWRGSSDGLIKIASSDKNIITQLKENLGWEQSAIEHVISNHFENSKITTVVAKIIETDLKSKGFDVRRSYQRCY